MLCCACAVVLITTSSSTYDYWLMQEHRVGRNWRKECERKTGRNRRDYGKRSETCGQWTCCEINKIAADLSVNCGCHYCWKERPRWPRVNDQCVICNWWTDAQPGCQHHHHHSNRWQLWDKRLWPATYIHIWHLHQGCCIVTRQWTVELVCVYVCVLMSEAWPSLQRVTLFSSTQGLCLVFRLTVV